jgi:small conductance mechanosensitive channel
VFWNLQEQAKEEFDKAGITIPFPQRTMHLVSPGAEGKKEQEPAN